MPAFKENVSDLLYGDKDLSVITSHATVIDLPVIAIINSVRKSPITSVADMGGSIDMEEIVKLEFEKTSSGIYKASMNLKGTDYKIDLNRI